MTDSLQAPDLFDPRLYPHPVDKVEMIETHISWVFLAGEYVYKVKKPVRLPFLDFSSLAARRACCEEELRLNRRTAPGLYLAVIPVTGSRTAPLLGGQVAPIDYALQMRRFDQNALADRMAGRGALGDAQIDALAAAIAEFHARIPSASGQVDFGSPAQIAAAAMENFEELDTLVSDPAQAASLARLRRWTLAANSRLAPLFEDRRRGGFVRECHGDLHLRNIFFDEGRPVLFDCIEFNAGFRWIDVMSEVAFLVMDLQEHGLEAGARRLLNAYLEAGGDYHGLHVLDYYLAYRALVRAKVALIRAAQDGGAPGRREAQIESARYLALASRYAQPGHPFMALMHGFAGSGKTTVAQALLERTGAIRIRSDVERKRLHGLAALARARAEPYAGIYSPDTTRQTYERLKGIVRDVVACGRGAIVDAAFLLRPLREEFAVLGRELDVPVTIVSCTAPPEELRRRLARREAGGRDASDAGVAVLENQMLTGEPLDESELSRVVCIDTGEQGAALQAQIDAVAGRLAPGRDDPSPGP